MVARVLASNKKMLFSFMGGSLFVLEACLYKECVGLDGPRVDVLLFSAFKDPEDKKNAGKSLE